MAKFNGYKNWAQWNVSLWLNNDEGLYREMVRQVARSRGNRGHGAEIMLDYLQQNGMTHTPDGAKYTKTAILAAMVGL